MHEVKNAVSGEGAYQPSRGHLEARDGSGQKRDDHDGLHEQRLRRPAHNCK